MRNRTLALLIMAFFLIPMGLAFSVDEAEASGTTTVIGELYEDSDGNPIANAEVYVKWDIDENFGNMWYGTGVRTDSSGKFTMVLPEGFAQSAVEVTSMWIMCKTDSHVRISQEEKLSDSDIEGPSGNLTIDLGRIYKFPGKYIETESIVLDVYVKYNNVGIGDAQVTVRSVEEGGTGSVKIETTDGNGYCKFDLKPGKYSITVERGGFVEWKTEEPIDLGEQVQVQEHIDLKILPVKTYWGFDLPHLFTMIGLVTALIMTSLVLVYMFWVKRHPGPTRVIDDSPDFDDDDDRF